MLGVAMNTIFPVISLHREDVHWEDHLMSLTPVENREGIWFKREDYFAPLGYGGPNGSKLRQLIYLVNTGLKDYHTTILSGASIKSPQLSMSTIVGKHFGRDTEIVIGATKPHTAIKYPNIAIAHGFGATFRIYNVGYNQLLQKRVHELRRDDTFVVEYGITIDHHTSSPEEVLNFHLLGAEQVKNIPSEVESLIVPAGSCNSLTSILTGLIIHGQGNLQSLSTIGIGPDKLLWVLERLKYMGLEVSNLDLDWNHVNLHELKYCDYGTEMPYSFGGIDFHPTYEGKVMRWLNENSPIPQDGKHMMWIIGSAPNIEVVRPFFSKNSSTMELIDHA